MAYTNWLTRLSQYRPAPCFLTPSRRCQFLLRCATLLAVLCAIIQLIFEIYNHGDVRVVQWPSYGFVRPLLLLVVQPFGALCLYHPVFRWLVRALPFFAFYVCRHVWGSAAHSPGAAILSFPFPLTMLFLVLQVFLTQPFWITADTMNLAALGLRVRCAPCSGCSGLHELLVCCSLVAPPCTCHVACVVPARLQGK